MARKTKLTLDVQQRITQAIETGATYTLACLYGGITTMTFRNWMNRAEAELTRRNLPRVRENSALWKKEQPFVDFYNAVKRAEGRSAVKWLAVIDRAAVQDDVWQAAAWKLERRYPGDYGRHVHTVQAEVKGEIDMNMKPEYSDVDRKDAAKELFEALRVIMGTEGDTGTDDVDAPEHGSVDGNSVSG